MNLLQGIRELIHRIWWHTMEKPHQAALAEQHHVAVQLRSQMSWLLPLTEGELGRLILNVLDEYAGLTKPLTRWDRVKRGSINTSFFSREGGWSSHIYSASIKRRYTSPTAAVELYQWAGQPTRVSVQVHAVQKNLLMNLLLRKLVLGSYMGRQLVEVRVLSYWDNIPGGETDLVLIFEIPEGMLR